MFGKEVNKAEVLPAKEHVIPQSFLILRSTQGRRKNKRLKIEYNQY